MGSGELALPDLHRLSVWSDPKVLALCDSRTLRTSIRAGERMDLDKLRDLITDGEQEHVDFKAGVPFEGHFRAHLTATIAAMSNTPGGGVIVLGVNDDRVATGLPDSALETYDPTVIGNYLESRLSPMPRFRVIRAAFQGVRLAIIEVDEFDDMPVVVTKALENGPKRWGASGDILVRTPKAETRRADASLLTRLFSRVHARLAVVEPGSASRRQPPADGQDSRSIELPSAEEALGLAQAVIAGKVLVAHPYADRKTNRLFVAGYTVSGGGRAFILEGVGSAFRIVWESEALPYPVRSIVVEDIDDDDVPEFCFFASGWGTGAGGALLITYSPARNAAYVLEEDHCWQDRTLPLQARIELSPEPDGSLRAAIERLAETRFEMLRRVPLDARNPVFASTWWHADNGTPTTGHLVFRRYPGFPRDQSSCDDYHSDGTRWLSFYKGSLTAYIVDREEHFVAFSPGWSYNWVQAVASVGGVLWFGQHFSEGVKALHVSGDIGYVQHIVSVCGRALPEIESISQELGLVLLNGSIQVPFADLFACLDRAAYQGWPAPP